MSRNRLNLVGQRFGKLTVIEESRSHQGHSMWLCKCDCGNDKVIRGAQMKRANSTSCGSCCSFSENMEPARYSQLLYYKKNAANRGHAFNISSDTFKSLTQKPCIYCGVSPTKSFKGTCKLPIRFTGIDRKDNTKGYEEGNCFPCCHTCNRGKSDMSHEEYQAHLRQVALHVCKQQPHLFVSMSRFNYCNQEL